MKKLRLLLALVCLLTANAVLADDKPIPVEQLPAAARTFVSNTFKGQKITSAEKDGSTYECRLSDGTQIEFDRRGNWDTVECQSGKAVPASLVPKAIQQYVKANYAGQTIMKIDKERYGYEIELSNDLDLKFNKKGEFIGIDR